MDRCGSCGGLAATFGRDYLRCVKTIPVPTPLRMGDLRSDGPIIRERAPAGCTKWTEQQRADRNDRRRQNRLARRAVLSYYGDQKPRF